MSETPSEIRGVTSSVSFYQNNLYVYHDYIVNHCDYPLSATPEKVNVFAQHYYFKCKRKILAIVQMFGMLSQ